MIGIKIITKSHFEVPFLKIPRKKDFVTGEKYSLGAIIKNMGRRPFPGGDFQLIIQWPNKLTVFWEFKVGSLLPNDVVKRKYGTSDVLDDGPALFVIHGTDTGGKPIRFCNFSGKALASQRTGPARGFTHVHTIIPKRAEEFYTLWALIIAVISLLLLVLKDVIVPTLELLASN